MPSPTARQPGRQHPLRQHPVQISSSTNGSSNTYPTTRPDQNHHTSPAFPFSLRLPFQSNPTSASLAPSIAEGKPIPVDDTTAEHRTSALRELNHNYPSRHRYAKSTGAQNTTYSEPVIVRSYYNPVPQGRSGAISRHGGVVIRAPSAVPGSVAGSTASRRRSATFTGKGTPAGNGVLSIMARARGRGKGQVQSQPEEAKLPPMEAFTFKNFIATLDEQGNGNDISTDLDRIAEICARSRYSLSNQYEVHYGPHGSGANFSPKGQQPTAENPGPTLQAVTSDDERQTKTERKRRLGGRRNSRAMGTLETIMSSSRSSEDDKSKKKSAAELAEQVRGRTSTKRNSQHTSPAASTRSAHDSHRSQTEDEHKKPPSSRRTSSSLALIDNSKPPPTSSTTTSEAATSTAPQQQQQHQARASASAALVSEPALPQPATSQLEIQTSTAPETQPPPRQHARSQSDGHLMADKLGGRATATGAISTVDDATATGLLSSLAGWIPWATVAEENGGASAGRAEGSLRNLLKGNSG